MSSTDSPAVTSVAATTTRAAVIDTFGDTDVLHAADVPLPAPAPTQVRLAVAATAVNPVDLSTRAGRNIPEADALFPMVLGWDVAGTVVAVGDDVSDWQVGERAAAMVFQPIDQHGTYAEHINLDAALLARVPAALSLESAATVPLVGLTASQLLDTVDLAEGQTLLVDGPLGAVGRVVVALAVRAGIQVIGVVRPDQMPELLESGATQAVHRGDFTDAVLAQNQAGVDAAIDLVGGDTARSALASVRDGGRYCTSVPPYIDPTGPFDSERGVTVEVLVVAVDTARLTTLLQLAADGVIATTIEATYPLDEAGEAHARQAAGGLAGRILLIQGER